MNLKIKETLGKIGSWVNKFQTPLITEASGTTNIPTATYTNIMQLTLPAKGKYIVLAHAGVGFATGTTESSGVLRRLTSSGMSKQFNGSANGVELGGGHTDLVGYYETGDTAGTVFCQVYMYEGYSSSGGHGWMIAFPIGGGTA